MSTTSFKDLVKFCCHLCRVYIRTRVQRRLLTRSAARRFLEAMLIARYRAARNSFRFSFYFFFFFFTRYPLNITGEYFGRRTIFHASRCGASQKGTRCVPSGLLSYFSFFLVLRDRVLNARVRVATSRRRSINVTISQMI